MSESCCLCKSGHMCDRFCDLGSLTPIQNLKNISRGVFFSLQLKLKTCNFVKNNTLRKCFRNFVLKQNKSNIKLHVKALCFPPFFLVLGPFFMDGLYEGWKFFLP